MNLEQSLSQSRDSFIYPPGSRKDSGELMSTYLAHCVKKSLIQTETNPGSGLLMVRKYAFPESRRSVSTGEGKGSFRKDWDCNPGQTEARYMEKRRAESHFLIW